MAKMPVSVAKITHPETPSATIVMKKESAGSKGDKSYASTLTPKIASTLTPKKPSPALGKLNNQKSKTTQSATIVMKGDSAEKTEIIIAKPKHPSDEDVPTKFVPLGAIITAGDEINFHTPVPPQRKPRPSMKLSQTRETTGKFVKKDIESADNEKAQAARMKELRLLSMGKKLLDSCKSGNASEVRQFMAEGAPFIADWVGTSPLHYSVMNKHVEVTELLLKAGICKDAKNKVDRTPLHVAAHMGLAYMVKLLLSYGADVNCRDMLNMTPLHWAAESGDVLTTRILLDYGADTSIVSKFGKTAINMADQNCFPDIVKAILETDNLHPDIRMIKVSHLKLKVLGTSKGINPVAEILEPSALAIQKLNTTSKLKKVVLVAKENPEGGAYRGTLQIGSDVESDNDSEPSSNNTTVEMSADSALKLLKSHGVRMIEPDKDTVISSAVLNGHTIRLTEAGKLAFKSLEKNLRIDELTRTDQVLSPESFKNDRTSPNSEGPPIKVARLSTGQMMHKVSAEQLIDMKNENKIVIKGASVSQTSSLPECTIDLFEQNENGDSSLSDTKIDDSLCDRNAVYLQRMENKANLCLKQISTLKRQLKIKEDEHSGIRKQIDMFKACSKLSIKFDK